MLNWKKKENLLEMTLKWCYLDNVQMILFDNPTQTGSYFFSTMSTLAVLDEKMNNGISIM